MNPTLQKTLLFDRVVCGEVNRSAVHRLDVSGKGINVTRALFQLGKNVTHLTQLGGDLRPAFLNLCKQDNLDIRWVESASAIRFCYTVISGSLADGRDSAPLVTELVEESEQVGKGTEARLLAAYTDLVDSAGTVVISGTKARGFGNTLVPAMVRLAREKDKRVILDIRGSDLKQSLEYKPDVIKPNLFEFVDTFTAELEQNARNAGKNPPDYKNMGELSGDEYGVKENVASFVFELAAQYNTTIILSRGTRPLWYTMEGAMKEYPVKIRPPVNTTGCGDAFTAGLAAALDDGLPLKEAIARGMWCGGLNADYLKPGTLRE